MLGKFSSYQVTQEANIALIGTLVEPQVWIRPYLASDLMFCVPMVRIGMSSISLALGAYFPLGRVTKRANYLSVEIVVCLGVLCVCVCVCVCVLGRVVGKKMIHVIIVQQTTSNSPSFRSASFLHSGQHCRKHD